jgi:hypothetical protein
MKNLLQSTSSKFKLCIYILIISFAPKLSYAAGSCTTSGNTTTCIYTYSGSAETFIVPSKVCKIKVEAWGGGGGGSGGGRVCGFSICGDDNAGPGGAGGNYASSEIEVTPSSSYNLYVGSGGAGSGHATGSIFAGEIKSDPGGYGQASWFGIGINSGTAPSNTANTTTLVRAGGGGGGKSSCTAASSSTCGGSNTNGTNVGTTTYAGGSGGAANSDNGGGGGGAAGSSANGSSVNTQNCNFFGGNCPLSSGGTSGGAPGGNGGNGGTKSNNGVAGDVYGGGGGGGGDNEGNGANGVAGVIRITYTTTPATITVSAPTTPVAQTTPVSGQWYNYAYIGTSASNGNVNLPATYAGYYISTGLNVNTEDKWDNSLSPSYALEYTGICVPTDNHTVSSVRKGFPCGNYTLSIGGHDDDVAVFVNGVKIFGHAGCCDAHNTIWTGNLGPDDKRKFGSR